MKIMAVLSLLTSVTDFQLSLLDSKCQLLFWYLKMDTEIQAASPCEGVVLHPSVKLRWLFSVQWKQWRWRIFKLYTEPTTWFIIALDPHSLYNSMLSMRIFLLHIWMSLQLSKISSSLVVFRICSWNNTREQLTGYFHSSKKCLLNGMQ